MRREVGAEVEVEITAPSTLEFQIAVAPHPGTDVFESLRFVLNGRPIQVRRGLALACNEAPATP